MSRTTEEHFKIFKKECEYWVNFFSLKEWFIYYYHTDADKPIKDAVAWMQANDDSKNVHISLAIDWKTFEPNEYEIKKFAFHEVCELLLDTISSLANKRYGVTEVMVEEATHEIIARLQNIVFQQSLKERDLV